MQAHWLARCDVSHPVRLWVELVDTYSMQRSTLMRGLLRCDRELPVVAFPWGWESVLFLHYWLKMPPYVNCPPQERDGIVRLGLFVRGPSFRARCGAGVLARRISCLLLFCVVSV